MADFDPLAPLKRLDPELVRHIQAEDGFVFADGALPGKYKLLIALAFDAAHGAAKGVRSLASRALRAGATREEIGEALRVAYLLGGAGSAYTAAEGLAEFGVE